MKVSELIGILQTIKEEYGDAPVVVMDPSEFGYMFERELERVYCERKETEGPQRKLFPSKIQIVLK